MHKNLFKLLFRSLFLCHDRNTNDLATLTTIKWRSGSSRVAYFLYFCYDIISSKTFSRWKPRKTPGNRPKQPCIHKRGIGNPTLPSHLSNTLLPSFPDTFSNKNYHIYRSFRSCFYLYFPLQYYCRFDELIVTEKSYLLFVNADLKWRKLIEAGFSNWLISSSQYAPFLR